MAEFPSHNFIDDAIPSAAQFNTSHRAASRAHMTMLGLSAFNGVQPADGTGAVFGGLKVSAVSGTMRSQVSAGTGIYVDSSAFTSPLSPFGLVLLETADTTSLTHATADGTHPRIDLVCIRTQAGTQTSGSVLQIGGGSLSQDTVRGPEVDIIITTGTAAASPAVPSTPAGYIVLGQVYVPATTTDAANFRYIDVRPMRAMGGGPRRMTCSATFGYAADAVQPAITVVESSVPDGAGFAFDSGLGAIVLYVMVPSDGWRATLTTQIVTSKSTSAVTVHSNAAPTLGAINSTNQTAISSAAAYSALPAIGQRRIMYSLLPVVAETGGNVDPVGSIGAPVDVGIEFQIDLIPPS
jgi:hypothetical protein